jgi:hypothetical protein
VTELSTYQRHQEFKAARDTAWHLADLLEMLGEAEERVRTVLIAQRLADELRDFDSMPKP